MQEVRKKQTVLSPSFGSESESKPPGTSETELFVTLVKIERCFFK